MLYNVSPRHVFADDEILDAARRVVARSGPRAVTLRTVASEARAPNGSIYHRFGTLDELIARLWLRAARRTQEVAFDAAGDERSSGAVVAVALALYDFCLTEREDALLLSSFRRNDLEGPRVPDDLRRDLAELNAPVDELMRELALACFGRARRADRELLLLAGVDLPYGFARRQLDEGTSPPPANRRRLAAAVRATISGGPS